MTCSSFDPFRAMDLPIFSTTGCPRGRCALSVDVRGVTNVTGSSPTCSSSAQHLGTALLSLRVRVAKVSVGPGLQVNLFHTPSASTTGWTPGRRQ